MRPGGPCGYRGDVRELGGPGLIVLQLDLDRKPRVGKLDCVCVCVCVCVCCWRGVSGVRG